MKARDKHSPLLSYPTRLCFCDDAAPCGLGDNCMSAIIADIMRAAGYNVFFYSKLKGFNDLVRSVRVDRVFLEYDYVFFYDVARYSLPLQDLGHTHYIDAFFEFNDLPLRYEGQQADVVTAKFAIPAVDVAMNTRCGEFSNKRAWPYFRDLKRLFENNGITYFDLDSLPFAYCEPQISMKALSIVESASMYLGLDSGMSHYVACVAKRGLIIQSGYSYFDNWCKYPQYEYIEIEIPCKPCWISEVNPGKCPLAENACMQLLDPECVLERVKQMLRRNRPF